MAKNYRKLPALTPQDIQRFWDKVDKAIGQGPQGTCWEWKGTRIKGTYGWFGVTWGQPYYAHRIAFYITSGTDPDKDQVCHACDNPPCCNPDHLWKGTNGENQQDSVQKGRRSPNSPHGQIHHLTHLTDQDIREIREMDFSARGSVARASKYYEIDRHTLLAIRKGRTWKHLLSSSSSPSKECSK